MVQFKFAQRGPITAHSQLAAGLDGRASQQKCRTCIEAKETLILSLTSTYRGVQKQFWLMVKKFIENCSSPRTEENYQ